MLLSDAQEYHPGLTTTPGVIQTRLLINQPGDEHEQEADRVADQVMRMPEPQLQRAGACGGACTQCQTEQFGEEDLHLQTKRVQASNTGQLAAPSIIHEVLAGLGQPLDSATQGFMEPRFGYDFSHVRIHINANAAKSVEAVNALAFTMGNNIVFGAGQYQPLSPDGKRLLSHELTHVIQQSDESQPLNLQRQARDAPNAKTWTGAPTACGPDFCRPLSSEMNAVVRRTKYWPPLKSAIGLIVSSQVVPLWDDWASGGTSSIRNLTKDFGSDFAASQTTIDTSKFLMARIKAKLIANPPTVPSGGSVKLDIPTLIPADIKAINDPSSSNQMNFNYPGEIPGNIAGGIGKDQAATPIGKNPSAQNDERIAKGEITVHDAGTNLMVSPNLSYTVNDTIDLCPGNCGTKREQIATIPMSQWEATGISGDVPFTVDFTAPWQLVLPFTIPKPAAPAAPPVPAPAP